MKPYHHVRINSEIRKDLGMWLEFLKNPTVYCRPFVDFTVVLTAEMINWCTDASRKIGFGGILENQWFSESWPID